jgi:MOSC domain-containing protein YiiM
MTSPPDNEAPVRPAPAWRGDLLHICIAERASVEMDEIDTAKLIAGVGIEGDRYAMGLGYYSSKPHADRQVTLIEIETLEALARDHGIVMSPQESRRNLTTRGVPLNHLVGRHFKVGDVLLYGGRLNVPCRYLEELLDREVFTPLLNRSGLNCRIVEGGVIRRGDTIVPVD